MARTYDCHQTLLMSSLPSQTGNAGKFLTTDGTDASWGNALANTATGYDSLSINGSASSAAFTVNIGKLSLCSGEYSVAMGWQAKVSTNRAVAIGGNINSYGAESVAIGMESGSNSKYGIALGAHARVGYSAQNAIQLGCDSSGNTVTNNESGTMKVCLGGTNYTLIDSTGQIPSAMLTSTLGDIETLLAAI